MSITEAIALIAKGVGHHDRPQYWADLGCGQGLFTEALASLLPAGSHITAIDMHQQHLAGIMGKQVSVAFKKADFTTAHMELPSLDGILMANALHFVQDKMSLIRRLEQHMGDKAQFLIVEYDHSRPNQWEPYPIPFAELENHFSQLGYDYIEKTGTRKSVYGGEMYAAAISRQK